MCIKCTFLCPINPLCIQDVFEIVQETVLVLFGKLSGDTFPNTSQTLSFTKTKTSVMCLTHAILNTQYTIRDIF